MAGSHITQTVDTEADIWRAAWRIADPGASNPTAVARELFRASAFLTHQIGTDGVRKHPAMRLIAAQLASLFNVNADGGGGFGDAESEFIGQVERVVKRLDLGADFGQAIASMNLALEPEGIHGGDK